MVSSSHIVSDAPSSSGRRLLILFPGSNVRSLFRETVLHKLLQCESFPQGHSSSLTAPAWVPSTWCSSSGTGCSSVGPPWGHKPCQQTCSGVGFSLSTGPQVLAGSCSSVDFPQGHRLLQAYICSSMGSSTGCRWISAPPWTSHRVTDSFRHTSAPAWGLPRAAGGYLLHRGPPWAAGRQPASPWSSSWAAGEKSLLWHLEHLLPAPSSLTLVPGELFLSHSLTPLL